MKDIGTQLREAREKKKLSIQDVAIATKINNKIIKSIEDGDTDNLPAKPFLRGFVQTYARYLEIDVDDIMKKFLELQGSTKPKPQITEEGKSSQDSHEEVQNKFELYKKFAYVGATIVAIIFIYFIQKTVSRYEQESKVAKEQQEAVKSQIVPTEENKTPLTEAPAVPSGGAEVPTTATPEVKAEEKTEVKPAEVKPVETPKVEEKKVEEKKPETKPFVQAPTTPLVSSPIPPAATPPPAPKPAEVKPAEAPKVEEKKVEEKKPVAKSQQVIIEALDNVEIRYTKDGESERTVKLKPEQFLTIKAESKINLNVSDSGAVNIIHNGRDKGVPGNLGQPTKISYP